MLALQSDVSGEVFQIATGIETSIIDPAAMMQEVTGQDVGVQHGPPRQGDIRKNYSGIRKVQSVLGWQPAVGLRDGLRETWDCFRSQAVLEE